MRRGCLDHLDDAGKARGRDAPVKLVCSKGGAQRLVVLTAAVIDCVVEPDRGFDGLGVVQFGAVFLGQRQQRFDVPDAVIVAAVGLIKLGQFRFGGLVNQGHVSAL